MQRQQCEPPRKEKKSAYDCAHSIFLFSLIRFGFYCSFNLLIPNQKKQVSAVSPSKYYLLQGKCAATFKRANGDRISSKSQFYTVRMRSQRLVFIESIQRASLQRRDIFLFFPKIQILFEILLKQPAKSRLSQEKVVFEAKESKLTKKSDFKEKCSEFLSFFNETIDFRAQKRSDRV